MKMHVMLIFGGVSTEHMVSCRSAYNIANGLLEAGHTLYPVGISTSGAWIPLQTDLEVILQDDWYETALQAYEQSGQSYDVHLPFDFKRWVEQLCGGIRPDVIYPAVHGINCEDGVLQGLLEMTQIPYVGSGVLGSAISMDKVMCKIVVETLGVPQLPYLNILRRDIEQNVSAVQTCIEQQIGYPCFLKPNNGGSSVGTCAVNGPDDLLPALNMVAQYDEMIVAETFVDARELEVAVMGLSEVQAAPVSEIVKSDDVTYYDYKTKYFTEGALPTVGADIDETIAQKLQNWAKQIFKACRCLGYARVDFFMTKSGQLYFNEINNLPGFTAISLFPKAFEVAGYPLPKLVDELCQLAIQNHARRIRMEHAKG